FVKGDKGDNFLRRAALKGHTDIVRVMMDAGAMFRMEEELLLRTAAKVGQTDVVRMLLSAGADVHAVTDSSLFNAAEAGLASIVLALLQHGANLTARNYGAYNIARNKTRWEVVYLFEEWTMRRAMDVLLERGWSVVERQLVARAVLMHFCIFGLELQPLIVVVEELAVWWVVGWSALFVFGRVRWVACQ
ncbi:hypothetical protein HK097_004415, partial [Rhizophlyctis rosea]